MNGLQDKDIQCPYCGQLLTILIDCSVSHQRYVEDCQVCCRPIIFDVTVGFDGEVTVGAAQENE